MIRVMQMCEEPESGVLAADAIDAPMELVQRQCPTGCGRTLSRSKNTTGLCWTCNAKGKLRVATVQRRQTCSAEGCTTAIQTGRPRRPDGLCAYHGTLATKREHRAVYSRRTILRARSEAEFAVDQMWAALSFEDKEAVLEGVLKPSCI